MGRGVLQEMKHVKLARLDYQPIVPLRRVAFDTGMRPGLDWRLSREFPTLVRRPRLPENGLRVGSHPRLAGGFLPVPSTAAIGQTDRVGRTGFKCSRLACRVVIGMNASSLKSSTGRKVSGQIGCLCA